MKGVLAVGQFEELQNDTRALADSATAEKLRAELTKSGPESAALVQASMDSLGVAQREALDSAIMVAAIAAAPSLRAPSSSASGFAPTLRPEMRTMSRGRQL
ncbi:MAG: hypothetical protein OXI87_07550 [Albidovulum sp.]|nr:hypothetical protein [Albidovulum sp.]